MNLHKTYSNPKFTIDVILSHYNWTIGFWYRPDKDGFGIDLGPLEITTMWGKSFRHRTTRQRIKRNLSPHKLV